MRPLRLGRVELDLGHIVLEVFVIVLGVLLALGANEWREARSDRELHERILTTIRAEVESNRAELEAVISRRREQIGQIEGGGRGISLRPGFLLDSSWETAQATGAASLLDFGVTSKLAEIHQALEGYELTIASALELIYFGEVVGPMLLEGPPPNQTFLGFLNVLGDMLAAELSLLAHYEELAELVDPEP